ncbi:MAG: TAXI family TRAP transporter solute-binding subunit, partial [Desulfobacterales bacterium]
MMKRFLTTSLAMILVLMCASVTLAIDMGIVTGGPKGTYYQFGLNMQRLVQQNGINLKVANSKGSVENIYAVYKRPHTQLGLVQSDVLAFVSRVQTDPILKRIAQKIKLVFPLYNEEIHLVGNRDIRDFDDLAGKKVAIGKEGSGTYLTSKLLFEISEIEPAELLAIGTDEALAQLKAGRIDAMFYVAGVPVKLFQENVSERDELSVIPILNKNLTEFYPLAKIPAKTYPWQIEPVNTIAVKCALVTFNFRGINCDYVGRFANIIHENLEWLQINGHPKWNLVDLNYPLKG